MAGPFRCIHPSKILDYSMEVQVICAVGGVIIDPIILIIISIIIEVRRFWGRLGVGVVRRRGA